MCNPAFIGMAVQGGNLLMQGMSGAASKKQQAATDRYNARILENDAERIRTTATEEENIQRLKTAQLLGTQRAQLGAAGVQLGTGSALQLQEDTVSLGEADALRIRTRGTEEVEALSTQAGYLKERADILEEPGILGKISEKTRDLSGVSGIMLGATVGDPIAGVSAKWFTEESTLFAEEQGIMF